MNDSPDRARVAEKLAAYCARYHIDPAFELSTPYHLQDQWDSKVFPDAESPGCYLFYDGAGNLLYIGKVSLNHNLGSRIASYFRRQDNRTIPAEGHSWTEAPVYLQTIKVNRAYEAPSLEEYLLLKLQPCNNTRMGAAEIAEAMDPGSGDGMTE